MTDFVALNPLEQLLLEAQKNRVKPSQLFDGLCASQVFVMVNQPLSDEGRWVEGTQLLVLEAADDTPVIAVFSAPERSAMWHDIATGFSHGLLVEFRWVLSGAMDNVGIAVNPSSTVGLELKPELVKKLRATIEGH